MAEGVAQTGFLSEIMVGIVSVVFDYFIVFESSVDAKCNVRK